MQTHPGSLSCGHMEEKRQFSKKGHWSERIMVFHYANESNVTRECHFMNSTGSLKGISSSVLITTVINDGCSVLIEFRGHFKLGGIANI